MGALGLSLLVAGSAIGLFHAPAEEHMGDVQRIMYVHVPTAWNAMLGLTFAFVCALAVLWRGSWRWDARLEAGDRGRRGALGPALHAGLDLGAPDLGRVVGLGSRA